MLAETKRRTRRYPCPIGQQARCLEHEIVCLSGQRIGERSIDGERETVGRGSFDPVGKIGEGDQRIEQMETIGATADDVQPEIDLRRRWPDDRRGRRQPPCFPSAAFS
jgi:hypothetical protein